MVVNISVYKIGSTELVDYHHEVVEGTEDFINGYKLCLSKVYPSIKYGTLITKLK